MMKVRGIEGLKSSRNEYYDLTQTELIDKLLEKDVLIQALRDEQNNSELLKFPWVGNLGQWYWHVKSNEVIFNNKKVTALGYTAKELPDKVGYDFFTQRIHPDDYEAVMENMRSHLYRKSEVYEVEYRIQAKDGSYKWFYDRGKITRRDESGAPVLLAGIVFDITRNKQMEQELIQSNKLLEALALRDALTGAYNRRELSRIISQEILRCKRTHQPLSVIFLDIDHFKTVNDRFGHKQGDEVLKSVTHIIKSRVRRTDSVGRWGGEEFIIILPETELSSAAMAAEDLRREIMHKPLEGVGHVTASLGVTALTAKDTLDSLVCRADGLMYEAKKSGRNKVMTG